MAVREHVIALIAAWLCVAGLRGFGQEPLRLADVFSDEMVLQQGAPVPVWGHAEPGARVQVSIAGQRHQAVAGDDGEWRVVLDPLEVSAEPTTLQASTGEMSLALEGVLIGEVWLLAGQSNMAFALESSLGGAGCIASLDGDSTIRLLHRQPTVGGGPAAWSSDVLTRMSPQQYFVDTTWQRPNRTRLSRFSAVGAFFAQSLREHLDCPIGLIQVAVGGTPTEAWVPREMVLAHPVTADLELSFPDSVHVQDFVRDRPLAQLRVWDEAGRPGPVPEHPYRPGFMYEAAIAPLAGLPIAGVLWYQGESNAEDTAVHDVLFTMAVSSWRSAFANDELPVFWAQLPDLNREMWPEFRESQQRLADTIPNTGMAVTIGLGHPTDVHPREKGPVGERLARLALHQVYGIDLAHSGPRPLSSRVFPENQTISLRFETDSTGLQLRPDASGASGCWVAGDDRRFARADAAVSGGELHLHSAAVQHPVAARYAWESEAAATLFNDAGLPAAPFRTDDWPTIRVACVGDSITYGTGTRHPASNSYPSQLSRLAGPLFDVRNFGVPGSSVVNGLLQPRTGWDRGYANQRAYRRSVVFEPDIVIINLGINDVTNEQFNVEAFVEDYTTLIEGYRELSSQPIVIIWHRLAPLFPGQAYYEHPRLALIQQGLDRVVEATGVETLNMYQPFEGEAERFPDKIHPDTQGAGVIAERTRDKLASLGVPVAHDSQPAAVPEEE